ncbi:MAG: hypothetical protein ISR48_01600 [Alphaproteobacteria bacterium]|nr:hypothetical protein [Alphaproteobacteria bacterium]
MPYDDDYSEPNIEDSLSEQQHERGQELDFSEPLDIHLTTTSPQFLGAVELLLSQLRQTEAARIGNLGKMRQALTMVLANLYHNHALHPDRYTAYARSPSRYSVIPRYNRLDIKWTPVRRVADGLGELEYAELVPGFFNHDWGRGKLSRIKATQPLINFLEQQAITFDMIRPAPDEEVIILRDQDKKDIDYKDTPEIRRMRESLLAYNSHIEEAEIFLSPDCEAQMASASIFINYNKKRSRRIFNRESFDQGGLFYGPWWQNIPKHLRKHILINGNPTVERDYSAMHIHLLYGMEGLNYWDFFEENDDPYFLPNQPAGVRDFMKKVFWTAVNTESSTKAKLSLFDKYGLNEAYRGMDIYGLIDAFKEKHSRISHNLFTCISRELQNKGSGISEFVMMSLMDEGIIALNIHDSFIVETNHKEILDQRMHEAFLNLELPSIPNIH